MLHSVSTKVRGRARGAGQELLKVRLMEGMRGDAHARDRAWMPDVGPLHARGDATTCHAWYMHMGALVREVRLGCKQKYRHRRCSRSHV